MRTPLNLAANTLALSLLFFLSQCKGPDVKQVDATLALPDTTKPGLLIASDTIRKVPTPDTSRVAEQVPLTLTFSNLVKAKGPVIVGVYAPKNKFPDPKDQLKEYKFKVDSDSFSVHIGDLPFGEYALAIYQDVNSNGKIDKNLIGIPTEPYAFSNNFKPTVKAPAFKNCRFEYTAIANTVAMKMIR